MISDVLSDAAANIRDYLSDPATAVCYTDTDIQQEIQSVLAAMDHLRVRLDAPPCNHADESDLTGARNIARPSIEQVKEAERSAWNQIGEIQTKAAEAGIETVSVSPHRSLAVKIVQKLCDEYQRLDRPWTGKPSKRLVDFVESILAKENQAALDRFTARLSGKTKDAPELHHKLLAAIDRRMGVHLDGDPTNNELNNLEFVEPTSDTSDTDKG